MPSPSPRTVRFGVFEFDVETGDVWNAGRHTRLQEQPRQVLRMLLARPGELVTREEVRATLWPDDSFVDFDAGVNVVVNKIRHALHDSASSPRFIETVPRRGYRFIAPVAYGRARDDVPIPPAERRDIADAKSEDRRPGLSPLGTFSRLRGARWTRVLVGSVVMAVTGISAVSYLSRTGSSQRLRPLPVTSLPGMEYSPAVSPDGSHVAFLWAAGDQWSPDFQLYVQPIGADRPLNLTNGKGDALQPTWSPDGNYIAFLRHPDRTNGLLHDIVIVPATGGAERRLGTVVARQHGLSWSPDGKFLAVVDKPSETEPEAIYLLSTETGRKERVTSPPADYDGDCFPRFSPDGQSLAFVRARTYLHADVYVFNLVDRILTRLISDHSISGGLDWTQDGSSIVFASGPGVDLVWKVAATGGPPEALDVGEGFEPSTSRRNRPVMVFVRFHIDWNVWRVPGPLANGSNAPPLPLNESTQLDFWPRYSPDGKRIAFISRRSGTTEVWTSDSDGTNPARRTFLDRDDLEMNVTWSADAQHLAFTAPVGGGNHDIYVIAAQGGFPERVTDTPEDERSPSFSQDGRWVYFTLRKSASEQQIWKVPRAGGPPVQVTSHGGLEARESPAGRFLYFTKGTLRGPLGIWRMSLPNGAEEKIVNQGDAGRWDVYGKGVCYVTESPGAFIECYDAESHSVQRVAAPEKVPFPLGFSVSPDGKWILYTRVDRNESDLMMVENFR